jgi:leucyl aminopeptidase
MKSTLKKSADPTSLKGDLLVIPVGSPVALTDPAAAADAALGGTIARAVADGEIDGKADSAAVFHAPQGFGCARVAVVGVGDGDLDGWRRAGEAPGKKAHAVKAQAVAVAPGGDAGPEQVTALLEGLGTGAYRFERFKSGERAPLAARKVTVASPALTRADLARADRIVAAVAGARDLVNTPANHLTPSDLAAHAQRLAEETPGLTCAVMDAARLKKLGAGALLAVAQGSDQPPKMIVLHHRPAKPATDEVLAIVGKAVTFDSGGISIKPSGGMEEMKMDMGGGAAALEAVALIAALDLPVEVMAVVPATENLLNGRAMKPGDVVTAMNGKTVEVINTDAEGRLILADALTWAARNGATRIVDLATLTGAVVVALGEVYAGLFGSDEDWTAAVRRAGERSGDLVWPLPMHPRYDPLIRSKVADLSNSAAKRQAGPVYAAQFLREFTDDLPWCHLDIAGTGMVGGAGTGFGVRLLLDLAEDLAAVAE